MKTIKALFLLAFLLPAAGSFAQQADSISRKLLGRITGDWDIKEVYSGGKEITTTKADSAYADHVRFTSEAKYVLSRRHAKLDSGSFNTNEPASVIYLQSAADKDHLQEWKITLKSKTEMTMTGVKGSKYQGLRYECAAVHSPHKRKL